MARHPVRLLYIDDDPGLGRLVQRHFVREGYTVELALDGVSGVRLLESSQYDAVALDHYMPGQDGLETLALIRHLADPPPVIFVTGTNEGRVAVAALKAGAADYVVKDINGEFLALLQASIESALAAVRLRRARDAAELEVRTSRDQFEALADERAILLREVNHRVGNSLQLVASFLHLQATSAPESEVKTALREANSRVMAVAQVHRRLFTSDNVRTVALDDYLSGLLGDLSRSTEREGVGDFLTLKAERVDIDPDRAVAVGMIVTELVINAFKYAYPGGNGPIRVLLTSDTPNQCTLAVEDDGVGASATPPSKGTGLGQIIIRAMASKLETKVDYQAQPVGTRAALSFGLG